MIFFWSVVVVVTIICSGPVPGGEEENVSHQALPGGQGKT